MSVKPLRAAKWAAQAVGALLIFVALVVLLVGDVAFMGAPTAFKALAVVIGVGLLVLGFWLITWGRREMAK